MPNPGAGAGFSLQALSGESETIGYSAQGCPLVVQHCGHRGDRLRIFIMAGQHGDESDAREAAVEYFAEFESNPQKGVRLAVLADGNPDGAVAGTRRNARHIDLNRDHLLLSAPETWAVHLFVNRWRPDLIIDVHTYRPWRPELLQHGMVFPQDVMVDFPTNPAIRMGWGPGARDGLFDFLRRRMADASLRCDRYTLVRPHGIVRHSTLDIVDARNMFALRYEIPTVLLEGRRSSPEDPPIFAPPYRALVRSIQAVVEWASWRPQQIRQGRVVTPQNYDTVPIHCYYISSNSSERYMEMQSVSGDIHVVSIPGAYLPSIETVRTVRAPRAYAVPRSACKLLKVLARQNFETVKSHGSRCIEAELYRISCEAARDPPKCGVIAPLATIERVRLNAGEYALFPTGQVGGRALALLLEPESQFGVHRFSGLGVALEPATLYPVARVI
jgi:hypothetical protein